MGPWFVLAHIPVSSEKEAFNAVESYELRDDGKIATTYVFRDGGFDAELETLRPVATVRDEQTNATWGMQFLWPFSAEFLISYLDDEYETTIISRTARDYVWIMARSPDVGEERLRELVAEVERQGYDISELRYVPHRWPDPDHPDSP
jgi:apolipoprotein D and lipocalin family protein